MARRKNKKSSPLLIILILIIAAGYYYYNNIYTKKESPKIPKETSVSIFPPIASKVDKDMRISSDDEGNLPKSRQLFMEERASSSGR